MFNVVRHYFGRSLSHDEAKSFLLVLLEAVSARHIVTDVETKETIALSHCFTICALMT